jgi:enamidase
MSSLLIRNVGQIATGDLAAPLAAGDAIYCEDGIIREVGTCRTDADVVLDANGLLAAPGLVDSHSHPSFGDFTFTQQSVGWMRAYLHGGVTTLVSAGELHLPGLPLNPLEPETFKMLALLGRRTWRQRLPESPRVVAGTLLLAPGMTERDFDAVAAAGTRVVKFLFYPWGRDWDEARRYVAWAHERGLVAKIHSGGVSRSGVSEPAGWEVVDRVQPDVAGHINGGPIPISRADLERVVGESRCYLELTPNSGNYRRALETLEFVEAAGLRPRLVIGTDTPSGTGVLPRAMLRNVCFVASLGGIPPAEALALASGNVARAHGIPGGLLQPGQPADIILLGAIQGAAGADALSSIAAGDMPGVATVIVDGEVVVYPRSEQTPPPIRLARVERGHVASSEYRA